MENISNYYQIIFKKLFNISAKILGEYKLLLSLERSSKKTSIEYEKHYQILQEYLLVEKETYKSLKNNDDIIYGLLKKVAYFNKRATDFIIPKNNNSLIYTRMSLKLNNCLSDTNKNKSLEVFALFTKFDIYSTIHFENILLALILFQKYIKINSDLVLEDIFTIDLYSYSFMFPTIEDETLKNKIALPSVVYSATDWLADEAIVDKNAVTAFKEKKFEQVKNYMTKNSINSINYIFLLFYLKALSLELDEKRTNDLEELIKKSGLKKDVQTSITSFIFSEEVTPLIRKISFQI